MHRWVVLDILGGGSGEATKPATAAVWGFFFLSLAVQVTPTYFVPQWPSDGEPQDTKHTNARRGVRRDANAIRKGCFLFPPRGVAVVKR